MLFPRDASVQTVIEMSAHPRRWQVRTTVAILVLAIVTTLSGLLRPGHYVDVPGLAASYRMQDLTILVVGVPVLAAGLWYAMRGSLRGRIVWLGALAYMTYIWINVGLQVTFNGFFLVYAALFGLSLFTLVGGVATSDPEAVRAALRDRISRSLYAALLVVVAVGLAALWLSELVPATLSGQAPLLVEQAGPQALVSHFVDLSVVVPGLLVAAVWLYRDRAWGYLLAGVGLVLGAILAVTIPAMTVVFASGDLVTVSPVVALFTFLPVLVAAGLAVKYVVSIPGGRSAPAARKRGQAP